MPPVYRLALLPGSAEREAIEAQPTNVPPSFPGHVGQAFKERSLRREIIIAESAFACQPLFESNAFTKNLPKSSPSSASNMFPMRSSSRFQPPLDYLRDRILKRTQRNIQLFLLRYPLR